MVLGTRQDGYWYIHLVREGQLGSEALDACAEPYYPEDPAFLIGRVRGTLGDSPDLKIWRPPQLGPRRFVGCGAQAARDLLHLKTWLFTTS